MFLYIAEFHLLIFYQGISLSIFERYWYTIFLSLLLFFCTVFDFVIGIKIALFIDWEMFPSLLFVWASSVFAFFVFFLVGLFFICLSVISPGFIHLFPFILLFYICVLVFNFLSWALFILFIFLFCFFFFLLLTLYF